MGIDQTVTDQTIKVTASEDSARLTVAEQSPDLFEVSATAHQAAATHMML